MESSNEVAMYNLVCILKAMRLLLFSRLAWLTSPFNKLFGERAEWLAGGQV